MDILALDEEASIRTFEGEFADPAGWSQSKSPRSAWEHLIDTYTFPFYTWAKEDPAIGNCLLELTGLAVADRLPTAVLCKLYTFLAVCPEIEQFWPIPDAGLLEEVQDYQSHILQVLAARRPSTPL